MCFLRLALLTVHLQHAGEVFGQQQTRSQQPSRSLDAAHLPTCLKSPPPIISPFIPSSASFYSFFPVSLDLSQMCFLAGWLEQKSKTAIISQFRRLETSVSRLFEDLVSHHWCYDGAAVEPGLHFYTPAPPRGQGRPAWRGAALMRTLEALPDLHWLFCKVLYHTA